MRFRFFRSTCLRARVCVRRILSNRNLRSISAVTVFTSMSFCGYVTNATVPINYCGTVNIV